MDLSNVSVTDLVANIAVKDLAPIESPKQLMATLSNVPKDSQ